MVPAPLAHGRVGDGAGEGETVTIGGDQVWGQRDGEDRRDCRGVNEGGRNEMRVINF